MTEPTAVLGRRVAAYLVDSVIVLVPVALALIVLPPFLAVVLAVLLPLVYWVALDGRTGATVGKRLLAIRVVRDDGTLPVGLPAALKRETTRILDRLLFMNLVGFLAALLSEDRQRFGDRWAETLVVRADAAGGPLWDVDGNVLLTAENVTKAFGGLVAVEDVTFDVPPRSIVSIIGPNGAGKTTFFNMLTGLYRPTHGRLFFAGRKITARRPDRITTLGIARTFQNIRLFSTMTALENVMVGEHARMKSGLFGSILRPPWVNREENEVREKARETLRYVGLAEDQIDQVASNLSYGDQRRVEIARALSSDPSLLLLDEPTAGMNPQESARLTAFMERLRDERGLAILLIEHDMQVVMGVSERVTVLDHGEKIAEGEPRQVRENPRVVEAYLGKQG